MCAGCFGPITRISADAAWTHSSDGFGCDRADAIVSTIGTEPWTIVS